MIKYENSKTDFYKNLYDHLRNYNIKINEDALHIFKNIYFKIRFILIT